MSTSISTFYKFVAIEDREALKSALADVCARHAIKGTILLASEGLNATVSGKDADVAALLAWLRRDLRFADLTAKKSYGDDHPFGRMKIKIKPEIVTLGAPDIDASRATGHYVEPQDWNALIADPGVVVIDTRNAYEVELGTFAGARNPRTQTFSEFPGWVRSELAVDRRQKIAMFCTGGIRCEKASAFLLSQGFSDVYQLRGGILKYLETVPKDDSLWTGDCFVFDERVALEHGMTAGQYARCGDCGNPIAKTRGVGAALGGCHHCAEAGIAGALGLAD